MHQAVIFAVAEMLAYRKLGRMMMVAGTFALA